jgi:ubiquitin-like-conjugating enzyme ATG3
MPTTQVMEDVSAEHAHKTITVDPHPHLPICAVSIHPCRHADVMKRLVDNLEAAGKEFSVNQ